MKRARIKRMFFESPRVSLLAQRAKKEFCIAAYEDPAVNSLWFPPVPPHEIEAYWAGQPSVGIGKLPAQLGGKWIDEREYWGCDRARRQFRTLVLRLQTKERYWAMACCDDDSYLATPDGRLIFHAASTEECRRHETNEHERRTALLKSGYFKNMFRRKPNRRGFCLRDKRKERKYARRAELGQHAMNDTTTGVSAQREPA